MPSAGSRSNSSTRGEKQRNDHAPHWADQSILSNQNAECALWRMEKVIRPRQEGNYPDRATDCEEAMDAALRDIIDAGNNAGWSTPEMLKAVKRVLPNIRTARERDPDPADDTPQ